MRRLAAIVFADIVGYSREASSAETEALARRREVAALLHQAAREHGGRVVKGLGDGAMLEFASVVDAVRCALAIQEQPAVAGRLRFGIHVGDVVEEEGDLFGNAVNIAARLEKAAPPGGLCVSGDVRRQVRPTLPVDWRPVPAERLAGLPEPIEGFQWSPAPAPVEIEAQPELPPTSVLAQARDLVRRQAADDGPNLLLWVGAALGVAILGAASLSLAGWVGQFEHWHVVAGLLTMIGKFGTRFPFFVLAWFVIGHFIGPLAAPLGRRLGLWLVGPQELDPVVLERAAPLAEAGPRIAVPVDRALAAYEAIVKLGAQDLWQRHQLPMQKPTNQARREILLFLERASQLERVDARLRELPDCEAAGKHYREVRALHERHCARLTEAAEMFEQAEAQLSRAYLSLTASMEPGGEAEKEPLQPMLATFAALAEVLELMEQPDALPPPPSSTLEAAATAAEEPSAALKSGRG